MMLFDRHTQALRRAEAKRATDRARSIVMPGDRISRRMCGGRNGTFTFTHWDGDWMAGATVSDCHAVNVYRLNGARIDFMDKGWDGGRAWYGTAEALCQDCLRLHPIDTLVAQPNDPPGLCPACGGGTCHCPACMADAAHMRAGKFDRVTLQPGLVLVAWSEEGGGTVHKIPQPLVRPKGYGVHGRPVAFQKHGESYRLRAFLKLGYRRNPFERDRLAFHGRAYWLVWQRSRQDWRDPIPW